VQTPHNTPPRVAQIHLHEVIWDPLREEVGPLIELSEEPAGILENPELHQDYVGDLQAFEPLEGHGYSQRCGCEAEIKRLSQSCREREHIKGLRGAECRVLTWP